MIGCGGFEIGINTVLTSGTLEIEKAAHGIDPALAPLGERVSAPTPTGEGVAPKLS